MYLHSFLPPYSSEKRRGKLGPMAKTANAYTSPAEPPPLPDGYTVSAPLSGPPAGPFVRSFVVRSFVGASGGRDHPLTPRLQVGPMKAEEYDDCVDICAEAFTTNNPAVMHLGITLEVPPGTCFARLTPAISSAPTLPAPAAAAARPRTYQPRPSRPVPSRLCPVCPRPRRPTSC